MIHPKIVFSFLTISFLLGLSIPQASTYEIDRDHTSVSFKIRHLFSNVEGAFSEFEGKFDYDADHPETFSAQATLQAASIDTRVKQRDDHLRSADFFDAEKYPTLTFQSTQAREATKDHLKLEGILTLHGVKKWVVLDVTIHGIGKDPWGNVRAGLTATTTLNRKDFGLTWNKALETGQVLVGDEVMITIEAEGLLQEAAA